MNLGLGNREKDHSRKGAMNAKFGEEGKNWIEDDTRKDAKDAKNEQN